MPVSDLLLGGLIVGSLYTDLRWRRIPNKLLLPFLLLGLITNLWNNGFSGMVISLGGFGLGLLFLLLPYLSGGIGGGDVKFLATVGAIAGPIFVWRSFLAGAIVGGVLAIGQLALEGRLNQVLKRLGFWLWSLLVPGVARPPLEDLTTDRKWGRLPYAVPLAIGVIIARIWL